MGKRILSAILIVVLTTCVGSFIACNQTQDVEEHIHSYVKSIVLPTCTERGYIHYACECGDIYDDTYIEALGHKEDVIKAVEATCTEKGLTEGKKCVVCNTVLEEQKEIAAKGHQYTGVVTEPTCSSTGFTTYTCECGYSYNDNYVAKNEHVCSTIEIVDNENGKLSRYSCDNCGVQLEMEYVNQFDGLLELKGIDFNKDIKMCGVYSLKGTNYTIYKTITPEELGMPILNIQGDMLSATKEYKAKVQVEYFDDEQEICNYATFKVQGATSSAYPKKNYNVVFYKDNTYDKKKKILLNDTWGEQNKYCLKANWIDFSQSRNVVSGDIYGQIVKSRNISDEYDSLINGGAIDGYPVVLFLEGEFHGVYSLNIPKDDWLFGMGDETEQEAMVMCDAWVEFGNGINENWTNGWELEYCSTEDETWVRTSFNNMINFIVQNDGEQFKNGITNYINVERAIDSMIYTAFICAADNTMKNILWATYDGQVWTPSMYDMDGTWGLRWDGVVAYNATSDMLFSNITNNILWNKLKFNYKQEIVDRYNELRGNILTLENITLQFENFINKIPNFVYVADSTKWEDVPSKDSNNIEQILLFTENRIQAFDENFATFANS